MPVIALDTDVEVRLLGNRNKIAASDQYPDHTKSAVVAPPIPRPAAEDAMPTLGFVSCSSSLGADRGQAIRPMSP